MIKVWLAEFKFYLLGALALAAIGYHFYYGHQKFEAGKANGDKEVAALKLQYRTASEQAAGAARAMQSMYDAQAMADAKNRELSSEFQLSIMTATAQNALIDAAHFSSQLAELRKHDPTVAAWLDRPIPYRVSHPAGEGGPR